MKGVLHLEGRTYSRKELAAGICTADTELASKVLPLCHAWLSGEQEFALTTSGSTGPPREMRFPRAALAASAALSREALHLTPGMTALVCLDTRFVAGQMMLIRSLEAGLNLVVVPPAANPFAHVRPDIQIDFVALVPYQLETILMSDDRQRFEHLHVAIIGGAPLPAAVLEKLEPYPCRWFATYGMTETLTHIALRQLTGANRQSWFVTLPGVTIETDADGCLVIHAPHLPAPVHTRDVVRQISRTEFEWLGRLDFAINSGGVKIYPEVVEGKLNPLLAPGGSATRFFITAQPDPQFYQQVVLVIESRDGSEIRSQWTEICRVLDKYEIPKRIMCIPHFIETGSGKIDRAATLGQKTSSQFATKGL